MEAPLADLARALEGRVSFHMPGHGGKRWLDGIRPAMDTTELPNTDDLYAPEGPIARAQALCAEAVGARHTLFLANGSTSGNQAMLMAATSPGDVVLMPRNAHLSAIHACALQGLTPVFVAPRIVEQDAWVSPEDVLAAMHSHPEARAVFLTRPDYFGRCIDLRDIAALATRMNMRLLVDEAHGAHYPYVGTPASASRYADAWVQSAHKTLPALGASGYLHLRTLDVRRALGMLRIVQTSSPSFLLLASLDAARAYMQERGRMAFHRMVERLDALRAEFPDAYGGFRARGIECDPARLVLDAARMGYRGVDIANALRARGIDVEMADDRYVVCIPSVFHDDADYRALAEGLRALPKRPALCVEPAPLPHYGERVRDIRSAALGVSERVPLECAAGRISAACVGLYPPGIPWLVPGESISQPLIDALCAERAKGRSVFGIDDEGIPVCIGCST